MWQMGAHRMIQQQTRGTGIKVRIRKGIGAAREVTLTCKYDPGFHWLTGPDEVNYHTLADSQVEKELDELFAQVLATLGKEVTSASQRTNPNRFRPAA
jgi:hypothetical protein